MHWRRVWNLCEPEPISGPRYLHIEQPFVRDMGWPFEAAALTPLAYRPTPDGTAIVPIYAPGLPMLMAVFERLANRAAVFYVVPASPSGRLISWASASAADRGPIGNHPARHKPSVSLPSDVSMSDVPATAWWALSLALLLADGRSAALASGLAAGAAILTRPNLVPLAVIPGVLLLWRAARARDMTGPAAQRVVLFAAGAIPACLIVAIVNARLWGSPLASGYEPVDVQLRWKYVVPNLERYPRWLLNTQTPVILLAFLAPLIPSRKVVAIPISLGHLAVGMFRIAAVSCPIACMNRATPGSGYGISFRRSRHSSCSRALSGRPLGSSHAESVSSRRAWSLGLLAWHGVSSGLTTGYSGSGKESGNHARSANTSRTTCQIAPYSSQVAQRQHPLLFRTATINTVPSSRFSRLCGSPPEDAWIPTIFALEDWGDLYFT